MYDTEDTIAAIASAPEGAVRGIVRISGPHTLQVLVRCVPEEAAAAFLAARHPRCAETAIALDLPTTTALPCRVLFWPDERSYTRQSSAEIHTLGSPPLLQALLRRLQQAGARRAKPGEFTMRAFLAGRLDLTQAEAVLGVIDAEDQAELETALTQLAGGLAEPLRNLRESLLDVLVQLEAGLDFVEEDIEFISPRELCLQLAGIRERFRQLMAQLASRSQTSADLRIVVVGAPNAGKSSLINALIEEEAAIVSPVPGTTRDYLAARRRLGKYDCTLIDTAGVEAAVTAIEQAAQAGTSQQQQAAHLVLFCLESPQLNLWADSRQEVIRMAEEQWAMLSGEEGAAAERLIVVTKADLLSARSPLPGDWVPTSARTGEGLTRLQTTIQERLSRESLSRAGPGERSLVIAATADRCRESLDLAAACLDRACETAELAAGEELVAAEMRGALEALGEVAGVVYTDDVLDRIFSRFCIGK